MIHVTANHRDSIFSSVPSPRIFHTIAGFDAVDPFCIAGEDLEKATISTADFGYRFSAKVLERYQGVPDNLEGVPRSQRAPRYRSKRSTVLKNRRQYPLGSC